MTAGPVSFDPDPFAMVLGDNRRPGDCFIAACTIVVALGDDAGPVLRDMRLCHGLPVNRGPVAGHRYAHGWVEATVAGHGAMCIDYSSLRSVVIPRTIYYRVGQIEPGDVLRYDAADVAAFTDAWGTYGPWEEPVLSGLSRAEIAEMTR